MSQTGEGNKTSNLSQALDEFRDEPEPRWRELIVRIKEFESYFAENRIPQLKLAICRTAGHDRDLDIPLSATGVYLIYDNNEQILYIGVTWVSVESRVRNHVKRFECVYVDIIAIKAEQRWLATGLERFLIDKLHPVMNDK